MEVKSNGNNIPQDAYKAAGLGAAAFGAGTSIVQNDRLSTLAKKTVEAACSNNSADFDTFVSKNASVKKAIQTGKKGFFGKLNKALGQNCEKSGEKVRGVVAEVLGEYGKKAENTLAEFVPKEKLSEKAAQYRDKLFIDDVKSSLSKATRASRMLALGAAVLGGVIAGSIAREFSIRKSNKNIVNEKETSPDTQVQKESISPLKAESPVQDKTSDEKIIKAEKEIDDEVSSIEKDIPALNDNDYNACEA